MVINEIESMGTKLQDEIHRNAVDIMKKQRRIEFEKNYSFS